MCRSSLPRGRRSGSGRRRRERDISGARQRHIWPSRGGGQPRPPPSRPPTLKPLGGAGTATAVSGFPFVNRLALGQQAVKVGVVVPQTGPMALEAQEMLAATQIAVEDINAAGGGMGREVATGIRDSQFQPAVGQCQATELIEVEKAVFLVGAIVGFEGIAMAEVGCKNDVIVCFFGQNFLTVKGKMCKYQFGNNLTPYQTAAAAANFVNEQKMGKKWH